MKRLTASIKDAVVGEFKETSKKKFGYGKGALSKAIDEALRAWIKEH